MADPGEQLKKVLAFRRKLEETRQVLYRPFADEVAFKQEIDKHLVAFVKNEIEPPATGAPVDRDFFPAFAPRCSVVAHPSAPIEKIGREIVEAVAANG